MVQDSTADDHVEGGIWERQLFDVGHCKVTPFAELPLLSAASAYSYRFRTYIDTEADGPERRSRKSPRSLATAEIEKPGLSSDCAEPALDKRSAAADDRIDAEVRILAVEVISTHGRLITFSKIVKCDFLRLSFFSGSRRSHIGVTSEQSCRDYRGMMATTAKSPQARS
jgi:hypothetical protein